MSNKTAKTDSREMPTYRETSTKQLIIELPEDWKQLDAHTFTIPIQDTPGIFEPQALLKFTQGVNPAIVDSLIEDFILSIQRQQAVAQLSVHVETHVNREEKS